jgi:hypothetical protein
MANPLNEQGNQRDDAGLSHIPLSNQELVSPRQAASSAIREAMSVIGIRRVNGVPAVTLRSWRNGNRIAPRWFLEWLGQELARKKSAIQNAENGLAGYQRGRGQGASLRDWWKAKKAAQRQTLIEASKNSRL